MFHEAKERNLWMHLNERRSHPHPLQREGRIDYSAKSLNYLYIRNMMAEEFFHPEVNKASKRVECKPQFLRHHLFSLQIIREFSGEIFHIIFI